MNYLYEEDNKQRPFIVCKLCVGFSTAVLIKYLQSFGIEKSVHFNIYTTSKSTVQSTHNARAW